MRLIAALAYELVPLAVRIAHGAMATHVGGGEGVPSTRRHGLSQRSHMSSLVSKAGLLVGGSFDGGLAVTRPAVFSTIWKIWMGGLEPPLSRLPLPVRLRQAFLFLVHRTPRAPLSPVHVAYTDKGLSYKVVAEVSEKVRFLKELVEETHVSPSKAFPNLPRATQEPSRRRLDPPYLRTPGPINYKTAVQ